MPELPEVETIARDLESALIGQKVKKARFLNYAVREQGDFRSASVLKGKCLERISRRGKNLIFHFSGELAMVCHLKMTGRLILGAGPVPHNKHRHFYVEFDRSRLDFFDVRKFGRISIFKEEHLKDHPRLRKLGPEPFVITSQQFAGIVKKRNKVIKLVLLDQQIVAGLGNIYADESLFDAGIRPTSRPARITMARLRRLHESILKILEVAIKNRGSSVDDYLDGFGQSGNFQKMLKVYGKTNQPCPDCRTMFKRIVLGGRSSHFCPRCQR